MNFKVENEGREPNDRTSTGVFMACTLPRPIPCQRAVCFGCSFFMSMVNFGEKIEQSEWWPQLKDYFYLADWILNYRDGVTILPPNCKLVFSFF